MKRCALILIALVLAVLPSAMPAAADTCDTWGAQSCFNNCSSMFWRCYYGTGDPGGQGTGRNGICETEADLCMEKCQHQCAPFLLPAPAPSPKK